jgi:DNA-3-methyladenine glycosylase II
LGAGLSRFNETRSHHEKIIPKYGSGFLVTRGDAFTTLARAIVGQQISVTAAQAVWDRVLLASKKR